MVWNLWSRKEAAYKIYNRETEYSRFFSFTTGLFFKTQIGNRLKRKYISLKQVKTILFTVVEKSISTRLKILVLLSKSLK
jgi:hypothetical protein